MAERSAPGEALSERLAARGSQGLSRRSYGGIDVYTGPVARRALGALNARAFTLDEQIIVDPSFDPNRSADDAGLLAHEDEHRRGSGGSGGGAAGHNDAEEQRARSVERMTHQLMDQGTSLGDALQQIRSGSSGASNMAPTGPGAPEPAAALVSRALIGGDRDRDPMAAYIQMRAEGMSHRRIVDDLKQHIMATLDRMEQEDLARSGERDNFHR
jgi:hypothetical protein